MTDATPIPYRIRIGVTGHRSLSNPDQMQERVKQAIETHLPELFSPKAAREVARLRQRGSTPIAYSIVSPLAEGADRIVARAVLSYPNARLDVVLPLSIEDYKKDFETQVSRDEFHELLNHCRQPLILHSDGDRAAAYEAAGQYVVDQCDVLIAVWDHEGSRGRGGTAEIVDYAKQQNRPILRVWHDTSCILDRGHGLDVSALDSIDRFNVAEIPAAEVEQCQADIHTDHFGHPTAAALKANATFQSAKAMVEQYLIPFYVKSSVLAARNQRRFFRAGNSVYTFSALAVLFVALAVLFEPMKFAGFGVELLLLVAIVYFVRRSRRENSHQFWMENRFLTERLRCGVFLAMCGVDPEPIAILPFMGHAHTMNDWTVRVFDEIWNRLPKLTVCGAEQCAAMGEYVRHGWIAGQVTYHKDKRAREKKSRKLLEEVGDFVLPATILAAALHLMPAFWPGFEWPLWIKDWLTLIALVFPAVAASLAGVHAFREHLRLEKRSANIVPQLAKLQSKMLAVKEPEQFATLLRHVDEIMLRESQDWLMLMRYVDLKG